MSAFSIKPHQKEGYEVFKGGILKNHCALLPMDAFEWDDQLGHWNSTLNRSDDAINLFRYYALPCGLIKTKTHKEP
jgi:hypothetical protein